MKTGDPIPLNRITGLNGNGSGHEIPKASLPDLHDRRRGVSGLEKKDDRNGQEATLNPA